MPRIDPGSIWLAELDPLRIRVTAFGRLCGEQLRMVRTAIADIVDIEPRE